MQNNFDLKKFLVENKLTPASQMNEMGAEPIQLQVGDQITPDMLKDPSQFEFPMEIVSFSNDGYDDTVQVKRVLKKKGMFGGEKEVEDTFEDLVSNWERMYLKPNVRMSAQTQIDFDNPMNEGPFTLETLADYKIAFDIATDIGISAALVGFAIYKFGIKKTVEVLKTGAAEFNKMIKWAMGKDKLPENKYALNKEEPMEEAMVTPDNRVEYLANALSHVWNMGTGKNKIDLYSMAQSLVDDMFD